MKTFDILIHWGSKKFDTKRFKKVENKFFNKPEGGLWTSPIDSDYGWERWCEDNDFRTEYFEDPTNNFLIQLKPSARIYTINSLEDLNQLHNKFMQNVTSDPIRCFTFLDFEKISKYYDAIFLTEHGQWETRLSTPNLYGWDCESVLILNKNVVLPVDNFENNFRQNLKEFKHERF